MKTFKYKKGMSLAEIVVVLAVVAIVSTIVVSFSIMVDAKTKSSNSKVDAVADIRVVENIVEGWVYRHSLNDAKFSIADGNISCVDKDVTYNFRFADNRVIGELVGSEKLWFDTKSIESISFEMFEKNEVDNKDLLIICTINYYLLNSSGERVISSYIFSVNEYVKDII